ncbi:MAG: hypothetical protein LBH47_02585 [Christensenellaceae bacterium]|jgi:predicted nucleotidyltransferase|nr:hypothetical protein [Christensenellaceae bacterium]
MAFGKDFIKNASSVIVANSAQKDFEFIKPLLSRAVKNVSVAYPFFDPNDVEIYLQGSYANQTNIAFQSKLEIIIKVKKTKAFDPIKMKPDEFLLKNNFYIDFFHVYDVKKFKKDIMRAIYDEINQKLKIEAVNFTIPMFDGLKHDIDITPCFSYKYFGANGGTIPCLLVYNNSIEEHFLMFNNLHAENGNLKDRLTNGKFKEIVRLVKTIIGISRREELNIKFVRGYLVECLLYNVPNEMYLTHDQRDTDKANKVEKERGEETERVFLKVINWLNFADLSKFVCQNQIFSLWGNADGFWNLHDASEFVRDIIQFYNNFPSRRTKIAE